MSRFLTFVVVCALSASCATSRLSTPDATAGVEQASDAFWATRSQGDASLLAETFTETATFGVPGLPDAEGRNAIRELLNKRFANVRITDFKVHHREIDVIGDRAYELGWFSEINHHREGDPMRMEGRYLIVWKREPGAGWRVHRNFYNFSAAEPVESPQAGR